MNVIILFQRVFHWNETKEQKMSFGAIYNYRNGLVKTKVRNMINFAQKMDRDLDNKAANTPDPPSSHSKTSFDGWVWLVY